MGRASKTLLGLAALISLAAGGCAWGTRQTTPTPGTAPAYVQVSNHNWLDMDVYAAGAGGRTRLGTVTTGQTVKYRLPRTYLAGTGVLYLIADPVGSPYVYTSSGILVDPGATVDWRLENNLALSSYSVK